MSKVFAGTGYPDPKADSLLTMLVRMTDKSVLEYEQARACLTEYVDERLLPSPGREGVFHVSPLIHACDHLENCVDSLKRAYRFAEALLRSPVARNLTKSDLPREADRVRVTRLRDRIQHNDEVILNGEPGDPIGIRVHGDSVDMGDDSISYVELARWLERMSQLSAKLVS